MKNETTPYCEKVRSAWRKIKHWFRRFSWKAGVEDAIGRIDQERLWTQEAQGKPAELRSSRFLEMQYASNSLMYLLNRGFK